MLEKGITRRDEDYSRWYLDVIEAAQLSQNAPVRGCMIIRPNGFAIWEQMQSILDRMFKETGVENAYFPLLIPRHIFDKEAEHVEGFSPQVAVVTSGGGKELEEPLIVRPTSETIMYEVYSDWIQSWRDLPLLINQWSNVVRWELRTRPFLRTLEFLWQEGHTVHATKQGAEARVLQMLNIYKTFAQDYLAMPVITGRKSESERFPGADDTTTIEAMMQDKRALQAGTSHHLGQNFSKTYNIRFLNSVGELEFGWQTSWGVSTRLIGALIMTHSDDRGLVLPPRISPTQVVVIPILPNPDEGKVVLEAAQNIAARLRHANIRVRLDERDMRPGPKFFDWEKKGVPLRIEIGPRDVNNQSVVVVRRDTSQKETIGTGPEFEIRIPELLDAIQTSLYESALAFRAQNMHQVDSWQAFKDAESGFIMAHWCGSSECEASIGGDTQTTLRCIPFDQQKEPGKCVYCGKDSDGRVLFAKAY